MADKAFGVDQLDILGSGTPTISAPNQLNLDCHTVAISTSVTVGANLTVNGNIDLGNASSDTISLTGVVDTNIIPSADSSKNIGSNTVRFANGYFDTVYGDGSNLTNLPASGISTSPSNVQATWKLGGGSGSGFTFTGPGQDGSEGNPDIYLVRGQRYLFDNTTLAGNHPFQFRNAANNADYTDGVSGAQNGLQYINVQHDAPAQLKYRCTQHPISMLGNIYIVGQHLANGANDRVLTATSAYGMNAESNLTFDGTTLTTTQLNVSTGANSFETSANVFKGASGQKGVYLRSALSSATTPSYSSVDDTNTGIFLPGSDVFAVTTGGTERLRIRSDGKISTGTSIDVTNSYEFSVTGSDSNGAIYGHGRNHYLSNRSNAYASLTLKKSNSDSDATDYLQLRDSSNNLKASITGDGNWKPISGGGIDFSASGNTGGMTSELLNDYEEGTWTPEIKGTTGAGTASYSQQVGKYLKIGNWVYLTWVLGWSSGSAGGEMRTTGFPFTPATDCTGMGSVMFNNVSIHSNVSNIATYIGPGTAYCYFYTSRSSSGWITVNYSSSGNLIANVSFRTA